MGVEADSVLEAVRTLVRVMSAIAHYLLHPLNQLLLLGLDVIQKYQDIQF